MLLLLEQWVKKVIIGKAENLSELITGDQEQQS
jgi:hypothetical protein